MIPPKAGVQAASELAHEVEELGSFHQMFS